MRSALLCASSEEGLFLFVVSKRLRAFRNYFFTGGGRNEKRQLPRWFPAETVARRKGLASLSRENPLSHRCAMPAPPKGGALFVLTGRWQKAPPSGELDATSGSGLRGFSCEKQPERFSPQVPPKARCGCWEPQPGQRGSHFKSFHANGAAARLCGSPGGCFGIQTLTRGLRSRCTDPRSSWRKRPS